MLGLGGRGFFDGGDFSIVQRLVAVDIKYGGIGFVAGGVVRLKFANFVGIKHASNDFALVTAMLARFGPAFRVFVGLEEFTFPMMMMGAMGTMNAVANLVPGRVAALCNAIRAGQVEEARRLHFALNDLFLAVFFDTNPIPLKYMMRRMGLLARNEHRLPMVPATAELERRLDVLLDRLVRSEE